MFYFNLLKYCNGYNDRRISWLRLFHSAKQKSYIMHVFYRSEILSTTWFSQVWSNLNLMSFSFQLTWTIGTMIVASTDLHLNPVTIAAGIPSHGFYSLISSVSFIASLILSIESIWANECNMNITYLTYYLKTLKKHCILNCISILQSDLPVMTNKYLWLMTTNIYVWF